MTRADTPGARSEQLRLGSLLAAGSLALLFLFAANLITAALPVELPSPEWLLRVTGVLVNNGPIALLGFLLLPLAVWISPTQARLRHLSALVQQWAVLVVVAYILLLPLQGVAIWQGISSANAKAAQTRAATELRISQLRSAVVEATSTQDLQQRLRQLKGLSLPVERLNEPLPQLRQRFLVAIQIYQNRLASQSASVAPPQLWQLIKEAIRISVSSLALALAFAAGARRRKQTRSLLGELKPSLDGWLLRWRRERHQRRERQERRQKQRRADAASARAQRETAQRRQNHREADAQGPDSLFADDTGDMGDTGDTGDSGNRDGSLF